MMALAETEGFEPSIQVIPVWRFSKPLVSATHPRLRMRREAGPIAAGLEADKGRRGRPGSSLRTRFAANRIRLAAHSLPLQAQRILFAAGQFRWDGTGMELC